MTDTTSQPLSIAEIALRFDQVNAKVKVLNLQIQQARQDKANAKRRLELRKALLTEEVRLKLDEYGCADLRKSYVTRNMQVEDEALSVAMLKLAGLLDERQRLQDYRDDLKEMSFNEREIMRSIR